MTGPAGARLVALIGAADAANQGTTPEEAVADAVHEALLAQPVLRTCLVPGCMRQYDARSRLTGEQPPRPDWSGDGWHTLGMGSIFPAGGHICPEHAALVGAHLPKRLRLDDDWWGVLCGCGWTTEPRRWHGVLRALWEEHILTASGALEATEATGFQALLRARARRRERAASAARPPSKGRAPGRGPALEVVRGREEIRNQLDEPGERPSSRHVGGNAEDCIACQDDEPEYPWICPGEEQPV